MDSVKPGQPPGVAALLFFHHDPTRTDDDLETIVARARDASLARGNSLKLDAASEAVDVHLERRR